MNTLNEKTDWKFIDPLVDKALPESWKGTPAALEIIGTLRKKAQELFPIHGQKTPDVIVKIASHEDLIHPPSIGPAEIASVLCHLLGKSEKTFNIVDEKYREISAADPSQQEKYSMFAEAKEGMKNWGHEYADSEEKLKKQQEESRRFRAILEAIPPTVLMALLPIAQSYHWNQNKSATRSRLQLAIAKVLQQNRTDDD